MRMAIATHELQGDTERDSAGGKTALEDLRPRGLRRLLRFDGYLDLLKLFVDVVIVEHPQNLLGLVFTLSRKQPSRGFRQYVDHS